MKPGDITDARQNAEQSFPYGPYVAVPAEGRRIGITNCKTCGAAIMFYEGQELDPLTLHEEWHASAGR